MKTSLELPANGPGANERWVRLPTKGHQPDTGLGRSFIYGLIREGVVKTANIRKPGSAYGVRLVWLPSLLAYIEKHATPITLPTRRRTGEGRT